MVADPFTSLVEPGINAVVVMTFSIEVVRPAVKPSAGILAISAST